MKLSIETYIPSTRFGDEKAFEMIKNAGFDGIDYSFYDRYEHNDEYLGAEYKKNAEKVKELLKKYDLTCTQAHGHYRDCSKFDETNKEFSDHVHSLEAASIMGAKHIIIHSLPGANDTEILELNERFYKAFIPYCEKFNIKIAIENLYYDDEKSRCCRGRLHTAELLHEMLRRLDSEWFGICIDIGHTGIVGIEPDELIKAFDNKTLIALHIHDNDYKSDQHLFPYNGNFDWNKITAALSEIDYKGDFTLELVGQLSKYEDDFLPEGLAYAAKIGRYVMNKIK